MAKRCVVTGIGIVSPIGTGKEAFWQSLTHGKSGISHITYFNTSNLPAHFAGEVKDFDASMYVEQSRLSASGRYTHFAVGAAKMAVDDANILPETVGDSRIALIVGTTSPPVDCIEDQVGYVLKSGDAPRARPHALDAVCPHSPAVEISSALGLFDVTSTISTVCTSGVNAIGAALKEIRAGRQDIVLAGATESTIALFTFLAYISAGLLALNDHQEPEKIMRPFDRKRNGGVLSEGAVFMVLEELDHARLRGAHVYGEVAGYAARNKVQGPMRSLPIKQGMANTMREALADARISPSAVDYVCANGVSTLILDKMETLALKEVFGKYAYRLPITSVKSMTGIANSCSSMMEMATALLAFETDVIPPTINYENPDPACDLDYVPNVARVNRVNAALVNNHGLDGGDAVLIVKRCGE